ncbi:MAG: hypothetical protein WC866_02095 [Patescibacteria group bacterium]|jgi:hypothetical protein
MHILDFRPEEIAAALAGEEKAKKSLDGKLDRIATRIGSLTKKLAELKKEATASERRIEHLNVARALHVPIPEEVWNMRVALGEMRVKARETDSKSESASLGAEISRLEKALLAKCSHSFVINAAGYQAYQSNADEDRSEPGERFCAICNHHEREYATWSGGEGGYKQLVEAEHRVWGVGHREKIGDLRKEFLGNHDLRQLIMHFTPQRVLELLQNFRTPPTK